MATSTQVKKLKDTGFSGADAREFEETGTPSQSAIDKLKAAGWDTGEVIAEEVVDIKEDILPKKATTEESVVERWEVETEEAPWLGTDRETFININAKQAAWQKLTDEEKIHLGRIKTQRGLGQSFENIFWEEETKTDNLLNDEDADIIADEVFKKPSSEIISNLTQRWFSEQQIQQVLDRRTAKREETTIRWDEQRALAKSESIGSLEKQRATAKIQRSTEALQNQTQRLRSLRWVWRGTATESEILALEEKGQSLINTATAKIELEQDLRDAKISWAAEEQIASLEENILKTETALQEKLAASIEQVKIVNDQIDAGFDTSINNMLDVLEISWVEIWDYDDKASKALGYISDSKGNPLKLDADGNPIAPRNDLWQDVKISNFKDANNNTYVYTNGLLTSIIQNDWSILQWDEVNTSTVPAEVKANKAAKENSTFETQLRKEFNWRQEIKDFVKLRSSFSKIKTGAENPSAAWDIALVFNFMKMLDPGSTVREWEFATAQNAAWVPERIRNELNKLQKWERLWDAQRKDFLETSRKIFDTEKVTAEWVRDNFNSIADAEWLRSEFIVWSFDTAISWDTPGFQLDEDETTEVDSIFGTGTDTPTTDNTFKTKSGKTFNLNFNGADQSAIPKDVASARFNNRNVTLNANALNAFDKVNAEFKNKFNRDIKLGSEITASSRGVEQQQKLYWQGRTVNQLIKAWFSNSDANKFATPDKNIVTNADWVRNKSRHQSWLALDIRWEDIDRAKPILESLGFKQTIPKWDAGHFEFIS